MFFELLLLLNHIVKEMIDVDFRSDDQSNAMVVKLVDHFHKTTQHVWVRDVELGDLQFSFSVGNSEWEVEWEVEVEVEEK